MSPRFLAATRTYDVGNIEVLRGPQAAIYGGESIGGVLWMETPYGSESPHGATTFEAGSFNSLSAQSACSKANPAISPTTSPADTRKPIMTRQTNSFHQGNTALRVEGKIDPVWTVGTTFRAVDSVLSKTVGYPMITWIPH